MDAVQSNTNINGSIGDGALPESEDTVLQSELKDDSTGTERTAYVSVETESDMIKRNNLYLATAFTGFVWMLFHFTVVFFFTLTLGSPLLVGLFLGLGNVVSLVLDVPVSIVSRFFNSKKLFLFGAISMFGA